MVQRLVEIAMNRKTQLVSLLLVAFVIRAAYILTLEERLYWPDERVFDNIALSLINGNGYASGLYRANPVLPFFLATLYELLGHSYLAARLVQSIIGTLTVLLMFSLAQRLFNRRVAFLCGLVMAFYPPLIYICGVFVVTCLFTFLIALSMYLLSSNNKPNGQPSVSLLVLSGVALGITVLCRPIFLSFIPFAAFFVAFSYTASTVRRISYAVVLVVVAFLTIFPWTLRNYVRYERLILVSTGKGLHLWRGNNELSRGDSDDRHLHPGSGRIWTKRLKEFDPSRQKELTQTYGKVVADLQALDQIERDTYLQNLALSLIIEHPGRSLALFARKVKTLFTPFSIVHDENMHIITSKKSLILSFVVFPTIFLGLFGAFHSLREWRKYLLLYLLIASQTLAYGLLTACTRFRIPIDPYIILFASYGMIVICDFILGKKCTHSGVVRPEATPVSVQDT